MFSNVGGAGSIPATPTKTCQITERKHDPKFIIQHRGSIGGCEKQQTSAAAFFARASHKASPVHVLSVTQGKNDDDDGERTNLCHVSDFAAVLGKCPPPVSPLLLKKVEANEALGMGKVRVILRVANSGVIDDKKSSFFKMDKKKRQVTLYDPAQVRNSMAEPSPDAPPVPAAPKMFAFDGLFTDEDPQIEVGASALVDPIHAVVQGTDAALFCFGHSSLGKTYTMIGSDESSRTLGIIPTAIAWLFRAVKEKREKTNTRFSVRVSALEIGGTREEVRDLLLCAQMAELHSGDRSNDGPPPSAFLPQSASSANAALLPNQAELRCPTAEKAGDLLDAALTARGQCYKTFYGHKL
jgi:kinesin family member 26